MIPTGKALMESTRDTITGIINAYGNTVKLYSIIDDGSTDSLGNSTGINENSTEIVLAVVYNANILTKTQLDEYGYTMEERPDLIMLFCDREISPNQIIGYKGVKYMVESIQDITAGDTQMVQIVGVVARNE